MFEGTDLHVAVIDALKLFRGLVRVALRIYITPIPWHKQKSHCMIDSCARITDEHVV